MTRSLASDKADPALRRQPEGRFYFFKNSNTSAGCASAFPTGIQCFLTVPSGPIKAVERIGPSTVSP